MKNRFPAARIAAATLLLTTAGIAAAADTPPDVCDHTSRSWSTMRSLLVDIVRLKGKADGDVQKLIRQALAGTEGASIDEFDIQYARGRTGAPPPNDAVCYPRHVRFAVTGNEAGYACKAEMSVKGAALSLKCEPTAG